MRKFAVLSLSAVLITVWFATSAVHSPVNAAQATPAATPNADCNPGKIIDTVVKLKKTGDKDKDGATLQSIEDGIEAYKAACAGLSFKGTAQKVLGPFELPAGNYKAVATTSGFFIAEMKVLSGDCAADGFGALFNVMSGDATAGAESTLTSSGCRLTIAVSNVHGPWTLVFEEVQ